MKKKAKPSMPLENLLLNLANRITLQARKAEDPIAWREACRAEWRALLLRADEEKENAWPLVLKAIQKLRDADLISEDVALALIYVCAVHLDSPKDPDLNRVMGKIGSKIVALRKRNGLAPDDSSWSMDDPNTPDEFKVLARQAADHSVATILKQYGEDHFADLLIQDKETFKRRFKGGLLAFTEHNPDITLDDEFFARVL